MKVPGLPLRTELKISSVTADLIFYQAKHDKQGKPGASPDRSRSSKSSESGLMVKDGEEKAK
jgi:hypothetical protein